jgi:hypothetical protein
MKTIYKNSTFLPVLLCLPLLTACAMFRADTTPSIIQTSSKDNTIQLTLKVRKGECYQLENTKDLIKPDWQPVGNVVTASSDTVTVTDDSTKSPTGFYRVRKITR